MKASYVSKGSLLVLLSVVAIAMVVSLFITPWGKQRPCQETCPELDITLNLVGEDHIYTNDSLSLFAQVCLERGKRTEIYVSFATGQLLHELRCVDHTSQIYPDMEN